MDRCDPRSRPLATNRAAHRAEKISAAYRNPRRRRQGIPGLRCRATPNTANLLSENRPRVTAAGVSLSRLTSRNSLTLKNFSQRGVADGLGCERLSKLMAKPSMSLHRMLSPKGNPGMDNLAAIFSAVRKCLKVGLKTHTVNLQKVA